jgi:hypothetical protein
MRHEAMSLTGGKSGPRLTDGLRTARALDAVGKIWALPNTIVGFAYGALGHVIGQIGNAVGRCDHAPRISFGNNAIQFEHNPLVTTAIALGNVIIYGNREQCQPAAPRCGGVHTLGVEEMHHTYQAQVLGPLYLPAHGILGVAAKLANGYWHGPLNVLEAGPHDEEPRAWKHTGRTYVAAKGAIHHTRQ